MAGAFSSQKAPKWETSPHGDPTASASPHRDTVAGASSSQSPPWRARRLTGTPWRTRPLTGTPRQVPSPHRDTMAGSFPSQSPPMAVESPHTGRHPLATPAPPGAAGGGSVRARALREGGKHCEPVHFPRFYYLRELDRTCKRHNCEVASTGLLSTETAAGGGRAPGGSGGPEQRHLAPLGPKKTAKCLKFIAWHLSKFATSETD